MEDWPNKAAKAVRYSHTQFPNWPPDKQITDARGTLQGQLSLLLDLGKITEVEFQQGLEKVEEVIKKEFSL